MSQLNGSDPLDQLRAADPIRADDVPDANLARVQAKVQEHIMSDSKFDPTVRPTRGPLAKIAGVAIAGAFALALAFSAGFGLPGSGGATPTDPVDGGGGGGAIDSCIRYDPSNLPTFDVVFDGTVTGIDGDQVTFDINSGWKGADGSITLTAPESNIALTGPAPEFSVGGRYLVTAAGTAINTCGYTLDYDAATAADWAAAFGG